MTSRWRRVFDPRLIAIGCVLLAVALTRGPLVTSPHSYLDGDEAMMGLTALHVLAGEPIPVLPYGAVFGVSLIETLSAVAATALLGPSEFALRLSALSVWALATALLALAARRVAGRPAGITVALLAVVAPGWLHPSLAVWHYHLSGYLGVSIAVYASARLLAGVRRPRRALALLALGVGLAFFAQPIYALAASPFAAVVLLRRRWAQDLAVLAAGFGVCAGIYALASHGTHASWSPPLFENPDPLHSLRVMPRRLWVSMTGVYFQAAAFPAGPRLSLLTGFWAAGFAVAAAAAVRRLHRDREADASCACLLGIALVLLFSLAVDPELYGYRYLLPVVALQPLLIGIELGRVVGSAGSSRLRAAGAVCCIALAVAAALEVRAVDFSGSRVRREIPEADALAQLVRHLEERGVEHVYATGPMFQWKLMFASHGRITARWLKPTDRYPAFPLAVDRARVAGRPFALVGEVADVPALERMFRDRGFSQGALSPVAEGYFAVLNPPVALLGAFRMNE